MKAIVLLFLFTALPLFGQNPATANLATVESYHKTIDRNVFVPSGTYLNKLNKEEKAAVNQFNESVSRIRGKLPLSEKSYALIASGKRKYQTTERFDADKGLKEKRISKEEYAVIISRLDSELLRERKIRADIILNHPKVIPVLISEQHWSRLQCEIALDDIIAMKDASVTAQ